MKHRLTVFLLLMLPLTLACDRIAALKGKSATKDDAATLADDCGDADCTKLAFVRTVSSNQLFQLFAADDTALGAFGRSMKFFVDGRDPEQLSTYYMNANFKVDEAIPQSAILHYAFAKAYLHIPEPAADYNQATYFTNDKRYFAGTVQKYHLDAEGIDVYGVQFFPQDIISGATIVKALKLVAASFHIPESRLAFVVSGEQQTLDGVEPEIAALGFRVLTISDVLGSIDFMAMNLGSAVGYLRLFPASPDDLRPTDIAVFDGLPLDLAVVAGVITKSYQDPNSHVNLKSRERGTPNMVLRSAAADLAALAPFKDKAVRLTVDRGTSRVEASTDEEVQAALAARLARPWIPMATVDDDRLLSYDEMCPSAPTDCLSLKTRFGSKAANLGFLASPYVLGRSSQSGTLSAQVGYDLTPHGFAVPFSVYKAYVNHPANEPIRVAIAKVVAAEKSGDVSPAERRQMAQAVRAAMLSGEMPAEIGVRIRQRMTAVIPDAKKVKVRSSANAEDLSGFNGAGLYDSYKARPVLPDEPAAGCVVEFRMNKRGTVRSKVLPDTLECAARAAWASLWNERAISERTWSRLEHNDAVMGLAIVPAYDLGSDIDANAVIVTRAPSTDDMSGYGLSTQMKNNLVTNPAPDSWSELAVAVLLTDDVPTSLTILRHAKPEPTEPPRTNAVLSQDKMLTMVEIAKTVELSWCRADPDYYPLIGGRDCRWSVFDSKKPKALDLELKFRADGRWVVKQVRPFVIGKGQ